MEFYTWTDDLSVGSDQLDGHHRTLIDCLNRLHGLIDRPDGAEAMAAVMAQLEGFVLVHFSEEEQYMRRNGYPDWRAHKLQHDKFYDVVYDLKCDIAEHRTVDARQLFDIVYGWLRSHILVEDRKYADYVASHEPHPTDIWVRANGRND